MQEARNFNWKQFQKQRNNSEEVWIWTDDNRQRSIKYLISKYQLKDIYDLRHALFYYEHLVYSFQGNCAYEDKFNVMVKMILERIVKIEIDINKFPKSKGMLSVHKKAFLRHVQRIQPTKDYLERKDRMKQIMENIPNLVEKLIENPFDCEISTAECDDPIMYVGVVNSTKMIAYVGSAIEFVKRKSSHKFELNKLIKQEDIKIEDGDGDGNGDGDEVEDEVEVEVEDEVHNNAYNNGSKFKNWLKENKLNFGEGFTLIPVLHCPIGFQKLGESILYDYLKLKQKEGNNVDLQNSNRPMKQDCTIESEAIIYAFFNKQTAINFYIGSTLDYFVRRGAHISACYIQMLKRKLYIYLRSLNETELPEHIQILPICIVPIGMQFEIEQNYIEQYDTISNGMNSIIAHTNGDRHSECVRRNRERYKAYQENNKDKIAKKSKKYREENEEKEKERHKKYYEENKEVVLLKQKERYEKNKEDTNAKAKIYRKTHVEQEKERHKNYRQENKEKLKKQEALFREQNRELIRENARKRYAEMTKEQKEERNRKQRENCQKRKAKAAAAAAAAAAASSSSS